MTAIAGLILAVISVVYSYVQNQKAQERFKKMQAEAEKRADEAKGFQVTVEAESAPLYIPYGRNLAGGNRIYHHLFGSVNLSSPAAGGVTFRTLGDGGGSKAQYMMVQQTICFAGINRIVHVLVDELSYTDGTLQSGVAVNVYPDGGVADPLCYNNDASRSTALFTGIAYATAIFKLNRDDPQFSGVPNLQFYIEGMKVHSVVKTGNTYSLGAKVYSNNPARCLLDYLMNAEYGKGLAVDYIDLESFYEVQELCNRVQLASVEKTGDYWTNAGGTRTIRRFETNIAISSETSMRDNIEKLLEGMDMAELIWTGGKYKLAMKYPLVYNSSNVYDLNDVVQTNNEGYIDLYRSLINNNSSAIGSANWARDAAVTLTDSDIVRGKELSVMWPNAQARFNQVTIKFRNESKNFKDDTVTWPETSSGLHNIFLAEDGGQELITEAYEDTITDYWHASQRAEQRCRFSRIAATYKFTATPRWTDLEPCDLIFLDSEVLKTTNALLRVSDAKVNTDGTVEISATRFDASLLAWNAPDTEYVAIQLTSNTYLKQATSLQFIADDRAVTESVGSLFWNAPVDSRISRYIVYATNLPMELITEGTDWTELGTTSNLRFSLSRIPPGFYTLAVAGVTANGRLTAQWGIDPANRWPLISVGVGAILSGNEALFAATVYYRSMSVPATPSGGVFNFTSLIFTTPPAGWSVTIPSGSSQLWKSSTILRSGDASPSWSAPIAMADALTRVELTRPVLAVHQDLQNTNTGYSNASGQVIAYLNGLNVTTAGGTTYTLLSTDKCTVVLSNTGGTKGQYAVTNLVGNAGSFQISVTFGGSTFYRTISVYGVYTGYQVDLTPPPAISGATVTVGLNTVFIELDELQVYNTGNGHRRTEIWGFYGETAVFSQATLLDYFTGTYYSFASTLGTPLRIWLVNVSMDDVPSAPVGGLNGFDATTGKIATGDIATKAITRALIGDAAIDSAQIADAAIVSAKIGQYIESSTYTAGTTGWHINKDGDAEFSNITINDGAGNVLMSSGLGTAWAGITGAGKPANGATRNVFRGPWTSGLIYSIGDVVLDAGSSWVATADHTASGSNPPPTLPTTSNTYWGLHASKGDIGNPADLYQLNSSAPILTRSGTVLTPNSVTCDATRKIGSANASTYAGRFKIYASGVLVYTSSVDEYTKTYTPDSAATSIKFEIYASGGTTILLDTLSVPVVDASGGLTVAMRNEAHVMSADDAGVVDSYLGSGNLIRVFDGANELSFSTGALFLGQYGLSATTVSPVSGITPGAITLNSGQARVADHTNMTADSVQITYTLTVRRLDDRTVSFPITQSLSKSKRGVIGLPGVNGTRTAVMEMYKWAASAPLTFPSGTSTYTWATGQFTDPATLNGWTQTPPAAVVGQRLWMCRTVFSDILTTLTSAIPWTANSTSSVGAAGDNGTRTALLEVYQWAASAPTSYPSGASTYTWATGVFTAPPTANGWSLLPGASVTGQTLWAISVMYSDMLTTATSSVTWNSNTVYAVGAAGANGKDSLMAVLSNESHTVQANTAGVVSSFAGCSTGIAVYVGTTNDTVNWSISPNATNITGTYDAPSKTYTVTAMSADSGYVDFTMTRSGFSTLTKRFSVAKSKAGNDATAQILRLSADTQAFTYVDGVQSPGSQSLTVTAILQNMTGTVTWSVSPAITLYGSGNSRWLTATDLGTNAQATITATLNGQSDSITIVRLDRSTAEAGATDGATIGTNLSGQITEATASTFIADGAIGNLQIGNEIYSSNFNAGSTGWKLTKTGNAELNSAIFRGTLDVKSAASGARLTISNDVIKVFDGNGVLRVKLGNLWA
jgi:hypothetical protein